MLYGGRAGAPPRAAAPDAPRPRGWARSDLLFGGAGGADALPGELNLSLDDSLAGLDSFLQHSVRRPRRGCAHRRAARTVHARRARALPNAAAARRGGPITVV
jgi:hypothetical protein